MCLHEGLETLVQVTWTLNMLASYIAEITIVIVHVYIQL